MVVTPFCAKTGRQNKMEMMQKLFFMVQLFGFTITKLIRNAVITYATFPIIIHVQWFRINNENANLCCTQSTPLFMSKVKTLGQFIIEKQNDFPFAKGELSRLLRDIGIAAKIVNREVNKAGLADILGEAGETNVQGEAQKKLDVFANEQFIAALSVGGEVCAIASEENEDLIPVDNAQSKNAKYVVAMDPLDGSSNIDVNVSVGTIFSIYRRISLSGPGTLEDFMQRGLHNGKRREWFHTRSVHRRILSFSSEYADASRRKNIFDQ